MSRVPSNFLFIIIIVLLISCNNSSQTSNTISTKKQDTIISTAHQTITTKNEDSIKLTNLVRDVYKWHVTDTIDKYGFEPEKNSPSDTLYTSINLAASNDAIKKLRQTGFFDDDFLDSYRKIAVRMDKELRDGTSLWPVGEISTFGDDADEWCDCQDFPVDDYWKIIKLTDIKFHKAEAIFKWTWGDNFYYKAKAKKENGNWKISYLQGFDMNAYSWEWWKKNKKGN